MKRLMLIAIICALAAFSAAAQKVTQGGLEAVGANDRPLGACPLKHTAVNAEISGFLARVRVVQEFENTFAEKIEAVYVFPLPNNAAVDSMTMRIGERTVRGKILRREEAREVYEAAKTNGQTAALLDQERTNIFTQAVANIMPGEKVTIEISYVETLKYEDGQYEFVFPMTVGPRYVPGAPAGNSGGGFAPDTDKVPDGSKITPPVAAGRAGHDISLEVALDAGVPLERVESTSHAVESQMLSASAYAVKLKNEKTIPNKDFVLRYDVAGKRIEDAVLTHRGAAGGYFTLILQPPDAPRVEDVTPKEIVFVLDTSGSMQGFPIEKAKESMKLALDGLNPRDTFNLITFAGDTTLLFDKPVPATPENMKRAQEFLAGRTGGGGTEMMKAIRAALEPSDSQEHVRVVCFMTDGYVGNEAEILAEIQKHPNARIFSFGVGSSVNRMLLDKMAEEGRGEVEYVALTDDGSKAARRFQERVRSPLLTDITVDFGGLAAVDIYPARINDLFAARPLVIRGRYAKPGRGVIRLKGKSFGRETVREIPVEFPESAPAHDVLATLWARTRVDELTRQDYGNQKPEIREQIANLGLEFRLLTPFTSFVAVEERVVTDGGQPRRIDVPVEIPDGVSREGVFGEVSDRQIANLPVNGRRTSNLMLETTSATVSVTAANEMLSMSSGIVTVIKPDADARARARRAGSENAFVIDGVSVADAKEEKRAAPIAGRALRLPKPALAKGLQWDGADGVVGVRVTLDAAGKVVEARAESGAAALRPAAEAAARASLFKIVRTPDGPALFTGTIVYTFAARGGKPQAAIALGAFAVKLTPEDERRRLIASKTAAAVFELIERVRRGRPAAPAEARFVRDGRAELYVRLKALTPEAVAALRALGFEVLTDSPAANAVVGRIALERLADLAALDAVAFVLPQNAAN